MFLYSEINILYVVFCSYDPTLARNGGERQAADRGGGGGGREERTHDYEVAC